MIIDFDESYDDFDDFDEPIVTNKRRSFKGPAALTAILMTGALLLQNTLAANININTGGRVEFGQGMSATAACAGSNVLTVTPSSSFINTSAAGAHYFNSVTVSGIPSDCHGSDFTINAYDSSTSNALALFNSTSKNAVVYNNAGTFELGVGSTGMSLTSGSGTFTVNFTSPVAAAGTVAKITLQSGVHVPIPCIDGGTCTVGEVGPGGGNIMFAYANGFNCGPAYTSTGSPTGGLCHYIEAAPKTWAGGVQDVTKGWLNTPDNTTAADVPGIPNETTADLSIAGMGLGYKNSLALVGVLSSTTTAAGAARAYTGGSKNDWYLPSIAELNMMERWEKGLDTTVFTQPTGFLPHNIGNAKGFIDDQYWSSSEYSALLAWSTHMGFSTVDPRNKSVNHLFYVRPVRAF
jgi:hypothetical protein